METTGQRHIDLAWASGLIDGEGCFTFHKSVTIRVETTSRACVEELFRIFGGSCAAVKRRTTGDRSVFSWAIYGKKAINVCVELSGLLKDKEIQAILLSRIHKYPPRSAMRESLQSRLMKLKRTES